VKYRLLSLALRGGAMTGKFLLVFVLARTLPPEQVGLYGLLTAAIAYSLYLVGLDFYTYAGREMVGSDRLQWPGMLRSQAALYLVSYVIVFPLLGVLFISGLLPTSYAFYFFVLLLLEHLSQEFLRFAVLMGRPVAGAAILFIRGGAWCYSLVLFQFFNFLVIDLEFVLASWALADLVVVLFGCWLIRHLPWRQGKRAVDWQWIRRGIRVAALFLVGTLALRGLFTFDRYIVENYANLELVGVYTFFYSVAFALIGFVDAAVFAFRYPALIESFKRGNVGDFHRCYSDFKRQTIVATLVLTVLAAIAIVPVAGWIGRPIYMENILMFYVLLIGIVIFILSHVPHYALYSMGMDAQIVKAHLISLIFFIPCALIMGHFFSAMGVALALALACSVKLAFKVWQLNKLKQSMSPSS
jgi:O-antigen/teichoic acid export membrane protein